MADDETLTTGWGRPVDDNRNSVTVGPRGPIVLTDSHLIEKLAHFNRERIPERVVHAKGAGAFGTFTITNGTMRKYSKAKVFARVGGKSKAFVRFSTVGGEKGSSDCARDPRGFAFRCWTEDGLWDITGNNTPVFFIRDPIQFPDFIHTQKRHPVTNLKDANAVFDFFASTPEAIHQATILYSPRGIPYSYRHMNGYGSHTFVLVNDAGDRFFTKFHFKTDQGIKNMPASDAESADPEHATEDLYTAIAKGDFPSWTVYIQVMAEADAVKCPVDVLDVTKVWPHSLYPLQEIGKLTLDRLPENYHVDVEQSAMSPANLVPGIEASMDKMLQGRLFAYPDAHRYRLGANYQTLPVNCPYAARNQQRDGAMAKPVTGENYFPNTAKSVTHCFADAADSPVRVAGLKGRHAPPVVADDFAQARSLFRDVMTDADRAATVAALSGHLRAARRDIQERFLDVLARVDDEYHARVKAEVSKDWSATTHPRSRL